MHLNYDLIDSAAPFKRRPYHAISNMSCRSRLPDVIIAFYGFAH
jgi:hypothetical protein